MSAELRRLILDGMRIIEPLRLELKLSHSNPDGSIDEPEVVAELKNMSEWVRKARKAALELRDTP